MSSFLMPLSSGLDDWYRRINRIYLDRNFYRDAYSIYAHLVEVVGGLSLLASDKKKSGVDVNRHVPRAVAWWFALCGKVGVSSVEQMLWWKFPYVCPYCQECPHDNDICTERKAQRGGPDWAKLDDIGEKNRSKRPRDIAGWQRMFGQIYKVETTASYPVIFARFTEELGELSEALRAFPVAPGYFLTEAADLFAWLMNLQNTIEKKADVLTAHRGNALATALESSYPNGCRDCGGGICMCPAILPNTLGRIAHEAPAWRTGTVDGEAILPLDDAMRLFGAVRSKITLVGHEYELTREGLREINSGVTQLIRLVIGQGDNLGVHSAILVDLLHEVKASAASQRLSDEHLHQVARAVADLAPPERQKVVGMLRDTGVGVLASGLVATVQTMVT
jgi:NTP pyrophosphatase (non-canonical NTP hydrolase)